MVVRVSRFFEILLVVFLVSLYTAVPIYVSGLVIPSAFTLFMLSPILLVALHKRIRKYDVVFLAMFFCVLLLTALLSPGLEFIGQKLLGLAQVTTSLATGILLLRLLDRVGRPKVAKILFVFSLVLVVGSFLEVMGSFWAGLNIIRAASDYFREAVYSGSGYIVYDALLRDINITGFERAKFFSSEPSVLAKGFLVFVNSWLLLSYNKRNFFERNVFVGLLLTAALLVLTGSPVLVVSAAISSAIAVTADRNLLRSLARMLPVTVFLTSLIGLLLLTFSPDMVSGLMQRLQYTSSLGMDSASLVRDSIGLRLILPALTLIAIWSNSPLFGVGISGKEVTESYLNLPVPLIADYGNNIGFGNNFMAVLSYFGIIGTILFVVLLAWYFRKLKVRSILLLFLILVAFSFTGGGFEEARFWGYVFLLIWAVRKRDEAFNQSRSGSRRLPTAARQAKHVILRSGGFEQMRKV